MKAHQSSIQIIFFTFFVDKYIFNIQIINLYAGLISEIIVHLLFSQYLTKSSDYTLY